LQRPKSALAARSAARSAALWCDEGCPKIDNVRWYFGDKPNQGVSEWKPSIDDETFIVELQPCRPVPEGATGGYLLRIGPLVGYYPKNNRRETEMCTVSVLKDIRLLILLHRVLSDGGWDAPDFCAISRPLEYIPKFLWTTRVMAHLHPWLSTERYDVKLLPIVQGSAGILFKCLEQATQEMNIPNIRRKNLYKKLHLDSIHTLHSLVPHGQQWNIERQKPTSEARGRIRGK